MSHRYVFALVLLLSGCADAALAPAAPGSTDRVGPIAPAPGPDDPAPSTEPLRSCRTLGPVQHLGLIYADPLSTRSLPVDAGSAQLATSALHNHVYIWSEGSLMMINNVGCLAATMEVDAEPAVMNVIGISAGPDGFIYMADRPFGDERIRLLRFSETVPSQLLVRVEAEVSEHVLPEGSADEALSALFLDWEAGLFYVMGAQLYEGSFGGDQEELVPFGPSASADITDATLAISGDLLVLSSGEVVQASAEAGIGGLVRGATYRVPGAPEGAVAFAHDNSGVFSLVKVDERTVSLGFHACQR